MISQLFEVIKSRRTIHQFNGTTVGDDLVRSALELALWAPNHKLTFPWRFVWVGAEAKSRLINLSVQLKQKKEGKELSEGMRRSLHKKLADTSHMIAIGCKLSEDSFQQREDYASVACGIQNACLFLHEQGVGSKWTTGGFTRSQQTYEILGVNPEHVEIVGVLLIGGYNSPPRTPERPELDELLTYTS